MNAPRDIGRPLDTSDVQLPEDVASLTEQLAEQIHRIWAAGRLADGWTYGPHRDDAARKHPGLVPYDQLPESEKDYDRRTSLETLRTIIKLGYRLQSDDQPAAPAADAAVEELHAHLRAGNLPLIETFKRLYPEDDTQFWIATKRFISTSSRR